ncbi:MAG: hypothetical protein ALECFALPRED_004350 [Alectoria fallacina]|uniref:Uncharacterized protein n=1 Tax=Alectoria fallacina TaxID=1903189 RepID=A0A8H3EQ70_9LECA|nr:MAG: hypothetical protein ALECFALPRED_004350 [Alectoria fallacina]
MPHFLSLLLLNLFFVRYVASSSLPETFNLTSNTTHLPTTQATCTAFKLFKLRPLYRDCNSAVDILSSSRVPGYFHSGRPMDTWQLPVTETFGTCDVLLQLAPFSLPERSSWRQVKAAARDLNEYCRTKKALSDVTGGAVTVGDHGRIQISIVRTTSDVEGVADG